MIRRITRIQILIWPVLCLVQLCLPIFPVGSFTFSTNNHIHRSRNNFYFPKRCNRQRSVRVSCLTLNSKRGEIEEEDTDDDYYSPRPARASQEPSRRATRQDKQLYTPYYEERSADKNFPFQDPLRPNDNNQKLAPYSSQSNFEDDDDDDDDYEDEFDDEDSYYDDEEDDFDDDKESNSFGGNFWSNPKGGIDRSMRPPAAPIPRLTRPRRRPVDTPGPNSSRRRRTPVRSDSMTQAPLVAKDFYERLFWYGFDPDESEQVGDKTVFGGTKGKFNGLAFLQASEVPRRPIRSRLEQQQRRPLPPSRPSRRTREDNDDDDEEDPDEYYYYDDDDDDEDDDDYSFVDGRGNTPSTRVNRRMTSTRTNVTPPEDIPNPRRERRAIPPPAPPQQKRKRPRPRENEFYNRDEEEESSNGRDWISKQVSSWFSGADDEEDDDDYDDDDDYRGEGRSTARQQRRRQRTGKSEWSPFTILDTFLGVNRDELAYKAEMYNSKMGIGSRRRSQRPTADVSQRERQQRTRENRRRRPGYAYRYNAEEEMDEEEEAFVLDVEPVTRQDSKSVDNTFANDNNVDNDKDEEDEASSSNSRIKDLTWEERALAVERVPPADIPGWGPSGELPYDSRTKAIMDALEDIQTARQKVEACEKKEALAKEEITILKVDAELQRRQLEESRTNIRLAQERLRQIELEIDDASRSLRRARTRVRLARDRLEELQVRHWAVLGFYNPDQAEEKVAEALAEYRLSNSMGNPLGDLNTMAPETSTTTTSKMPSSTDKFPTSSD